jgi:hypothetical protein
MKYLKLYENFNKPEIGDYVICRSFYNNKYLNIFLSENIGQIVIINDKSLYSYIVKYNSKDLKNLRTLFNNAGFRKFQENEILHFSKNKEDLELILSARKYNI